MKALNHCGFGISRGVEAKERGLVGFVKTQLAQRGRAFERRHPLRACGCEYAQLALLNQCIDGRKRVGQQQIELRASGVGHQSAAAFVGDVHKLAASCADELLHHDVRQRAVA